MPLQINRTYQGVPSLAVSCMPPCPVWSLSVLEPLKLEPHAPRSSAQRAPRPAAARQAPVRRPVGSNSGQAHVDLQQSHVRAPVWRQRHQGQPELRSHHGSARSQRARSHRGRALQAAPLRGQGERGEQPSSAGSRVSAFGGGRGGRRELHHLHEPATHDALPPVRARGVLRALLRQDLRAEPAAPAVPGVPRGSDAAGAAARWRLRR